MLTLLLTCLLLSTTTPTLGHPPVSDTQPEATDEAGSQRLAALEIGDAAPPVRAASWFKGDPVEAFAPDHVYVMEFWASWCVPCIDGMPDLSELQGRFEDSVTIIGMNIWEEPDRASAWVRERGDGLMAYTVALQSGEEMETLWMDAAGQDGIPTAFIVDGEGTIAWIGHPSDIEAPLRAVVDGTWDTDAFRAEFRSEAKRAERLRTAVAEFELTAVDEIAAFVSANEAEDPRAIAESATALLAKRPPSVIAANVFGGSTHRILVAGEPGLAASFIRVNLGAIEDDYEQLLQYGRALLTDELFADARDTDLAIDMLALARAVEGPGHTAALELLAHAHALKAAQLQSEVVESVGDGQRDSAREQLEAYRRAAEALD